MEQMTALFGGIYKNKRVLITGHTGFKGSWLAMWLKEMGAQVFGFALPMEEPNHLGLLDLQLEQHLGDIRDIEILKAFFTKIQPEIVFHLAAQAIVRESYLNPSETYSTNVMGTMNVLEACRATPSVRAIVNVTSDKCYSNQEWVWGYRESDPLGGFDPYSSSKGCAEILTSSYRNSFFNINNFGKSHQVLLASGRAGNVIGGGDWAADRLIPDIARAASLKESVKIRNPRATRPWQHVLEPLSGYLMLGWKLLDKNTACAEAWNFGPYPESNLSVGDVVSLAKTLWDGVNIEYSTNPDDHHEANLLMLDCSKAQKLLHWKPVWNIEKTLDKTIGWYRDFYTQQKVNTLFDLNDYIDDAIQINLPWAK